MNCADRARLPAKQFQQRLVRKESGHRVERKPGVWKWEVLREGPCLLHRTPEEGSRFQRCPFPPHGTRFSWMPCWFYTSFSFWWWVSLMIKFMCSIFLSVESAGPKMLSLSIEIKCQMDLGQTTWDSWEGNLFISVMINVLRLPIVLGEMKLLVFTFWLFDFGTLTGITRDMKGI